MIKTLSILLLFVCSLASAQESYLDALKIDLESKEDAKSYLYGYSHPKKTITD